MRTRCGKRGWLRAVLAAALCLTLASPQMNLFAQKVEETDKTCSLTVDAAGSDEEYAEDLKKAEITVKLYQIATITGTGRHKTVERFESLEQDLEKIMDAYCRKLQRLWAFEMRERRRRNKKNLRRSLVKRIKPFR